MSEPTARLNLIQRVMEKTTLAGARLVGLSPLPDAAVPNGPPLPLAERKAQDPFVPGLATGNVQAGGGQDVQLNYAKLRESGISTPEDRNSLTYNEFRSVKRKLIPLMHDNSTHSRRQNLVMITSSLPGEGKTFTSMNLALSLAAEGNLKVVLVDGDVILSTVKKYFIGDREKGLMELLTDENPPAVRDMLHRCSDLPNLHLLFAGKRSAAAPELFASRRMSEVLDELSVCFPQCIVLIDTPPVLASQEPVALVTHMNHLLMVISAGIAGRHQIQESLNTISSCPNINLLFNKAPKWQRANLGTYYYYGSYGADQEPEEPSPKQSVAGAVAND